MKNRLENIYTYFSFAEDCCKSHDVEGKFIHGLLSQVRKSFAFKCTKLKRKGEGKKKLLASIFFFFK